MKKTIIIIVLMVIISMMCLTGCVSQKLESGTYINSNDSNKTIEVNVGTIKFINVNFDLLNEELKNDLGLDLKLTEKFKNPNKYSIKDNTILVEIANIINIDFKYKDGVIFVNDEKYLLEVSGND